MGDYATVFKPKVMTKVLDEVLLDPNESRRRQGWRLRLYHEDAITELTVERVLPKKISNTGQDKNPNRVAEVSARYWLHPDEIRWLRDQLTRIIDEGQ